MTRPRLSLPLLRAVRAVRARVAHGDEGFALIETLIAVTLITVIMGAIGVEYVSGLVETNRSRNQTTAVQLADNTMETLRSFDPSDIVTARDKTSASTEYDTLAAYGNVQPLLGDKTALVYDSSAATNAGKDATVQTDGGQQSLGGTSFTIWQFLACTGAPVNGACVSSLGTAANTKVRNVRAVVAVTWPQSTCPQRTCSYATSTVINPDPDPTFDLNQPLPPGPVVDDPGAFSVAVGDVVSKQLTTGSANRGVTPLTWTQTGSLPNGLPPITPDGLVAGTIGGAASPNATGTVTTGVVATDAYRRPSPSQALNWSVKPALKIDAVLDQADLVGDSIDLSLTARGGSGVTTNFTFSDPGRTLPAGLSISADGKISGKPTAPGAGNAPKTNSVSLTVTDSERCSICTAARTATVRFTWTINYPPLAVTVPSAQTWTVATRLAEKSTAYGQVQMSADGGDGSYTWSATGLPSGVTISPAGLVSGTPPGTTASGTARVTATDATASNDTTSAQYTQTVTFAWRTVAKPTITTPAAQRSSVGAPINLSVASTCANAPCTYTLTSAPAGLTIDSAGKISGTVGGTATTLNQVQVSVKDAAGAEVAGNSFTWTVVDAPSLGGWSASRLTETEVYSQALTYSCAYASCTIALTGNQVPGLGLKTTGPAAGDNSAAKTLTVTAATGTVYLTGTVSSTAVTAGNTADYATAISITSGDNAVNSYSSTMTAAVVPTLAGLAAKKVSETASISTPIAYTCYTAAAGTPCTITLGGTVPEGLGLSTSATVVGNNGTRSLDVTAPTGTVYVAGTVQDTAVPGTSTSKAYAPSITIAPDTFYTSSPITATWTAYVPVTVGSPGEQRNTIGAAVSFTLATTCAATPCAYSATNLPAGLTINANGLVSGTVASSAVSSTSVVVTATDSGGASAATSAFKWTIDAAPTVTGLLATRALTVGGVYSNANAVSLAYTCPRTPCTITLGGSVPGLGLTTDRTLVGNQDNRTLNNISTTSGTVYVVGEVQSGAVTSGSSTAYTPSISITDGGSFTTGPSSATWTAYSAPTLVAPGSRNVSVGGAENTPLAYTCPAAARMSCTVTLTGTVPGVGLSTTGASSANNTTLTVTTNAASGTVYLTGLVQSSALGGSSSKAWTPSLKISDGGAFASAAVTGTWTAFPAPTLGALAGPRSLTETASDGVSVSYTCPDLTCSIQLANTVTGLGLATSNITTPNSTTTINVTSATGTIWVTGLVSTDAVAANATSQVYTPALTIKDGSNNVGNFTSAASTATWTAYTPPTLDTGPATRTVNVGTVDSSAYTYTCPRTTCTVTLTNPVPGLGLSATANNAANNTATTLSVTTSGSGTVYISGTVQAGAVPTGNTKTYSVGLKISDGGNVSSATASNTWTANNKLSITGLGALAASRNNLAFQTLSYYCPTRSCPLTLTGPTWVYLSYNGQDAFKSTTLTATSGTIYIGGTPGTNDTGGTVKLAANDGAGYSISPTVTWTVS